MQLFHSFSFSRGFSSIFCFVHFTLFYFWNLKGSATPATSKSLLNGNASCYHLIVSNFRDMLFTWPHGQTALLNQYRYSHTENTPFNSVYFYWHKQVMEFMNVLVRCLTINATLHFHHDNLTKTTGNDFSYNVKQKHSECILYIVTTVYAIKAKIEVVKFFLISHIIKGSIYLKMHVHV